MNTKSVVFVITAMLCTFHCVGQSNVVYYGTNSNALDVVFVDTNLSQKAQSAIVADLRVCLLEWGKISELMLDGGDEPGVIGYLYNSKQCPHYPDDIEFPDNIVSNGTAGIALQIPKELSDAYTNAFKFAAANANAFAAANAFVAFVSSTNFPNIPPKVAPNYILRNDMTEKKVIANAQRIIADLCHQTYYPPSVLGFVYSSIGPAKKNLWMNIPCSSPLSYSDRKEWGYFPAIWHKGKWKFCIWQEKEE
ncbi:MAG: hypothetical protein FWH21_04965 [Kiritimatiellaeota bacterium]|nr:hypothetical protein [Kiritimatiellota bacterium]